MTEDNILISHVRDLKNKCADNSIITNTLFLDLRQRSLIAPIEKELHEYVNTYYYGGYQEAERVCAIFIPPFYEYFKDDIYRFFDENAADNPLRLVRIEKDRFTTLTHRDYLGSLMGLGLKRETLGDILVDDNGCFVVCVKNAAEYVCESLESVGKGTVKARIVPFGRISDRMENFEDIGTFIASARLDNFVSAAFSLSRTKASEFIRKGVVYINSVLRDKPDIKVFVGDKVVLRGKGKVIFASIDGESKKGRLHITIRKYK